MGIFKIIALKFIEKFLKFKISGKNILDTK